MTRPRRARSALDGLARRLRGSAGPVGWSVHRLEVGRARRSPLAPGAVHAVAAAFAEDHPRAVVIEVGAHDGIQRDPLRRHVLTRDWTTYLLEPVPRVFAKLQRNVRFVAGAHPVNLAIAAEDGSLPFYEVRPPRKGEELWPWYDALGSFDREVILSHNDLIPDVAERITTTEVPAATARTFLATHDIAQVDLLQIDTEGFDLVVLDQFDIASLRPLVVIYEHWHLDDEQRATAEGIVHDAGYEVAVEGLDTLAVRRDYAVDARTAMAAVWPAQR